MSTTRSDARVGALLLVPVLVAVVFSWWRIAMAPSHVPADDDYVQARAALDAQHFDKLHDALAILPAWSLRPLHVMGDLDPISSDHLDERPLQRHARLFVLVEPDADDAHSALVKRLGAPTWSTQVGRVVVERFDLHQPPVTFDFRAHLLDAHVRVDGRNGSSVVCDIPMQRGLRCRSRPEWLRVQRQWLLVSENADDVVWSHPPPRGERLVLAWDDVPMGDGIVVRAGHTREGADQAKAPVRLHVLVNDEEAGVVTRAPKFHFASDVIDTHRWSGTNARVSFAIETDDDGANHFAWDATAIGAAP